MSSRFMTYESHTNYPFIVVGKKKNKKIKNKKTIEKQRQVLFLENSFVSADDSFVRKKEKTFRLFLAKSFGRETLLQRILRRRNERCPDKGINLSAGHRVENDSMKADGRLLPILHDRGPTVETDRPLPSTLSRSDANNT